MQKAVLENFIKRSNLGGLCEAAHWYSDAEKETLTARATTDTQTVILKVVLKEWKGVETCALAIPSASKVKSMLSPIGDEVTITLNKIRDRIANFTVSDNDCEAVCTVAEYDAFPETLDVDADVNADKMPTNFDVEMVLNEDFIQRFNRANAALSDSKDFVLMNNKKGKLEVVINYEDTNTNRIRIPVETLPGKDLFVTPMGFSTPVLKSILAVNDKITDSMLRVSNSGIAIIKFDDPLFKSTYFLFPTRVLE